MLTTAPASLPPFVPACLVTIRVGRHCPCDAGPSVSSKARRRWAVEWRVRFVPIRRDAAACANCCMPKHSR